MRVSLPYSIAIVAVAALVTWLLVAMYASRVSEEADRPFASVDLERKNGAASATSLIGTVTSVSEASLTMTAAPAQNPHLSRETAITVRLSPQTQFSRVSVPSSAPAEAADDLASLYRFAAATKDDLALGIRVNVRTGAKVAGKTDVAAASIEILTQR
ncbi:hypothetical protein A3J36_03210 [Candidatus Uhrbacteria bacterium RIFCSPLOWO2_02_FULL_54_37]|uniref:Uncharacterized protein n=2 Tax=Candidatus Uhriibacteriota TaxID=1752732 RepID=A0A1F7VIQ0_9BACT|nr:MAG: hypothetical protein A3B36_02670 [Candidatus Uhrbacteria bacterium RIFCSPLOWO2_01_FULL_55_36]OGL89864.1 MAG: hypothetical protein A3J36_03210 [Candidatus Uhrbacteria bacterium RIFCSPLOWO2_02_FULL_54_37]